MYNRGEVMKEIKLVKKSTLMFRSKLVKLSLVFTIFAVAFLIILTPKESYGLPFEGNMMNSFPSVITSQKQNIVEVYFINDTKNSYKKAKRDFEEQLILEQSQFEDWSEITEGNVVEI